MSAVRNFFDRFSWPYTAASAAKYGQQPGYTWPWPNEAAAEPAPTKLKKKISELTVRMSGYEYSWVTDYKPGVGTIEPWRHFVDWFMRRESPAYLMQYKEGARMLTRSQIETFWITLREVEVE